MRKILFLPSVPPNFALAWEKKGYQPVSAAEEFTGLEKGQLGQRIAYYKQHDDIWAVFTFNFVPLLAECCETNNVYYISWAVDCPHLTLWHRSANNPYVYNFVFDYKQFEMLRSMGMQRAFYLPLCADVDAFEESINAQQSEKEYKADVAFVGNLYADDEHALYDRISFLPPYVKGYLDALLGVQRKIWGENLLYDAITDTVWNQVRQYVKWDLGEGYPEEIYELLFSGMLAQKLAQLERKEVCSYLASHYDFVLYTDNDTSFDPRIRNCGHADYLTEMPLVFHNSKINIHITLRSITSGISLRVLDVLASEGFLLTNYQQEIAEYFVDGEELVMYSDFADMYEKIDYYLAHEEERQRIAHAGYLKVKELFHYSVGIGKIIDILESEIDE